MNEICFIHLREHRYPRSKLPELREKAGWNEDKDLLSWGGATIAYQVHRMSDSLLIKYAVAECQLLDRFRKDAGRGISLKRLKSGEKKDLLGEIEIAVIAEEDVERLIVADYYEYKSAFYDDGYPIYEYLYPHHPGYDFDDEEKESAPTVKDVLEAGHNVD